MIGLDEGSDNDCPCEEASLKISSPSASHAERSESGGGAPTEEGAKLIRLVVGRERLVAGQVSLPVDLLCVSERVGLGRLAGGRYTPRLLVLPNGVEDRAL